MTNILALNGAYRHHGMTDQTVEILKQAIEAAGGTVEVIHLREHPVEFCLNCRECTQLPGDTPGHCVLEDGMQELIDKIERADGYILASPTNCGSTTALFKRFMERLVVYAYWPWGMNGPQLRKARGPRKKAVLVSSCAAPGILGRYFFATRKQLTMTANTLGADTVGVLFTGLIGKEPNPRITARLQTRIQKSVAKLI